MEKLLWNRCFICSSELEPEVAVAEKDRDDITPQSQTKLGSNPKTVVKENQAIPATKSCRNQRQNESPPEKAHSSFSDSPEDEGQQGFKLEAEDQCEDESSLYSSDEDQSDPTPAADKAPPKPRGPADKSHEDILLHYLLTYCQQNRIIGKLLFDDIKKLRSASSNYDGVHRVNPTLNRKCVISIQFCESCDHLAKNLKHLHSQLEVLQISIINQLKIVKQAVINNSRQYGCNNEGMKSDFNKFEQWLNQKGTLPEDWDTGRKFLQVLQQFQTTVFESSTRMCDMQLELLLKFMCNSRVPPPPPVYKKRKPEKAPEIEEQEVTDFDSNSEDEEEVSFEPDLLETVLDVTEDPLNLKAPETISDHKLMAERRKNRLVHKLNPQRRKNSRTVLAERTKKLKMMLQKKPFTKAIVQQSGEYRVTINQHSPFPPQSPNENVKVIEFQTYQPGYKVEVIKKVKSHKVTTIADAPFLARKFRRKWMDRRKEKKLKKKGQMLCEICPYTTVGASRFEQHLREHETLEKKWTCPVCSKRFTTKQYYELHLIYYCGVELWRCDACDIAVNRKRMSEHLKKRHEGSKVYNCQHCDLFYVNFSNLATHSLCHPGGFQSLKCQLCSPDSDLVPFNTKRSVLRHLVEEHDQTQLLIKCDYENCSATYFFMGDLWTHKQTHLDKPSSRCSTCDKTFSSNKALQLHIKTRHLKEKIFACSKCSEKFTTVGRREKHLIKEHGITNYKCDLCTNKVFNDPGTLKYHKQIKHNVGNMQQFQCGFCDKKFYYKRKLKEHEKTHSDSKDFTCEICGFATRTAGLLKSHIANHDENKIKNHSCEYCQKKFSNKEVLKIHIRIHTLERPFQCDICGSTFNQPTALRVHKKKHVENKSFKPRPSRYLTRKKKAMEMEEGEGGVVVGVENSVPPVGNLNANSGGQEPGGHETGKHHYMNSSSATSESTNRDQHLPYFATSTNMSAVPSTSSGYPLNDI